MNDVKILADSTCDLPRELKERLDIGIIPLYVLLGDQAYRDGVDIDPEHIYAHFERTQQTPTTSAPSVQDLIDAFRPYAREGRDIVFFCISSEMSATYQNALLAAREFPDVTIRVVDSRSLSSGIALLASRAAEEAQAGLSAPEIADRAQARIGLVRASFVIDTLIYLYRGGRCSRLQMMGANALNLKPKIVLRDGFMGPEDRYRGRPARVVEKYTRDVLRDIDSIDTTRTVHRAFPLRARRRGGSRESGARNRAVPGDIRIWLRQRHRQPLRAGHSGRHAYAREPNIN